MAYTLWFPSSYPEVHSGPASSRLGRLQIPPEGPHVNPPYRRSFHPSPGHVSVKTLLPSISLALHLARHRHHRPWPGSMMTATHSANTPRRTPGALVYIGSMSDHRFRRNAQEKAVNTGVGISHSKTKASPRTINTQDRGYHHRRALAREGTSGERARSATIDGAGRRPPCLQPLMPPFPLNDAS